MPITDEQARALMFGDLKVEDIKTEEKPEETKPAGEGENLEEEDIDIDNDEELKELAKQSPKLNSAFAKLRRQAEKEAKEKAELAGKVTKYSEFVKNKYSNEYGIEDLDSFFNYMESQTQEEAEEAYNALKTDLIDNYGVDPNLVDNLIANNPKVKQLESLAKKIEADQELEKLNKQYEDTFNELKGKYPQFDSIENINKVLGDKAKEFWTLFKDKGLSMKKAYEVVAIDDLLNSTKKTSEQETLNKINSKSHLKPTKLNAEVDYKDIDQEELAWYEGLMGSKMSHQQMIEHSKKNRR